jgi:hypothetical protein
MIMLSNQFYVIFFFKFAAKVSLSPVSYLQEPLWSECALCINVQSLSFTTALVQWKLQCKLFTYFTPTKQNEKWGQ